MAADVLVAVSMWTRLKHRHDMLNAIGAQFLESVAQFVRRCRKAYQIVS